MTVEVFHSLFLKYSLATPTDGLWDSLEATKRQVNDGTGSQILKIGLLDFFKCFF